MSGSFFYVVHAGGRIFSACRTQDPAHRTRGLFSRPFWNPLDGGRQAAQGKSFAFPDSARRERARASARFPLTKKQERF